MGVLPILQKNQKQWNCLGIENLPTNYMSDYSVLGLMVDRLDTVLQLLMDKKYEVQKKADGFEITIDGAGRMSEIVSLFQQNSIDYAVADLVDQVYQG